MPIIPIFGPFHQQCSFIYAIYKRFRGSGISDVLVSTGVIVEGSVNQALRGKHIRHGVRCIMLMREVLIHSRIKEMLSTHDFSETTENHLITLRSDLNESQKNMGDFWLSFLEMSDVLIQNIHACHIRSATEYLSSTYNMLKYLMAYNNHNYGRWLPDYWASISSLPKDKYSFFADKFTLSLTGLPFSLQVMGLWIECTMNLGSKLKQGWLNLLDNEKQLLSTTRNMNNIVRIRSTVKRNLKKKDRRRIHVDCQMSRVKKDERAVQDIEACLQEFDTEPFDESNPALCALQSVITASAELVTDVKNAVKEGDGQGQTLLQECVYTKQSSIRDTISRNKRIDLASDYVPKACGENMKQKANQMEKNGLISIFNLRKKLI